MKKLGLVLGSGGARGVAHVGFLQALNENHIKPDVITGCSIGSIVGAAYLAGKTPQELLNIALLLRKNDIIDFNPMLYSNKALLKSKKMRRLISKLIMDKDFESLPIPFGCIATDLVAGKTHFFKDGNLAEAIQASCSIPTTFPPIEIDGMFLVDGGLINRIPVAEARSLGAEVVVAVDILGELPDYDPIDNIIELALRAIDVVSDNCQCNLSGENIADITVIPKLGNISQYKVKNQQKCYDAGYTAGIKNIDNIKKLIK